MANPARDFVNKASDKLSEINSRQRNFKRSQAAYQRLEKARDIMASGRAAILYHSADMQDGRVVAAQTLIDRIEADSLDMAVTFGKV